MSRNKSENKKGAAKAPSLRTGVGLNQPMTWSSFVKTGTKVRDIDPDQVFIMTAGELLELLQREFDAGAYHFSRQF